MLRHRVASLLLSEIKSTLKPSFRRPYLQIKLQNSVSVRGLYDTGADISCLSQKVFRQIPPQQRPRKLLQSLNLREGRFYQLMVNTNLRFKLVQSPYNMSSTSFPI